MRTVKELQQLAKSYGIKAYSKMRKAELEQMINDFEVAAKADKPTTQPVKFTVVTPDNVRIVHEANDEPLVPKSEEVLTGYKVTNESHYVAVDKNGHAVLIMTCRDVEPD